MFVFAYVNKHHFQEIVAETHSDNEQKIPAKSVTRRFKYNRHAKSFSHLVPLITVRCGTKHC